MHLLFGSPPLHDGYALARSAAIFLIASPLEKNVPAMGTAEDQFPDFLEKMPHEISKVIEGNQSYLVL